MESQNPEFKIFESQIPKLNIFESKNPEFKIFESKNPEFKILDSQTPEFMILESQDHEFQNLEFRILASKIMKSGNNQVLCLGIMLFMSMDVHLVTRWEVSYQVQSWPIRF